MTDRIRIEFATDSAAFEDDFHSELSLVMTQVARHMRYQDISGGYLRDSNGVKIGQWTYEGKMDERLPR